jgi:hypothetical protein
LLRPKVKKSLRIWLKSFVNMAPETYFSWVFFHESFRSLKIRKKVNGSKVMSHAPLTFENCYYTKVSRVLWRHNMNYFCKPRMNQKFAWKVCFFLDSSNESMLMYLHFAKLKKKQFFFINVSTKELRFTVM